MIMSLMSPSAVMATPLFSPRVVAALAAECGVWAVSCATLWRLSGTQRDDDPVTPHAEEESPRDSHGDSR